MHKFLAVASGILLLGAAHAQDVKKPKNVILMIGDGMGYNAVAAGSFFQYGEERAQPYWQYQHLPMATWSESTPGGYDPAQAWETLEYFLQSPTDSAAAATTLNTGVKTKNGAIGVDASGKPLRSLVDDAEEMGKATGVLSTVYLSHATPASFVAHDPSRKNVELLAQEMVLKSSVDLIMAPGHPLFDDSGKPASGDGSDPESKAPSYNYVGGEDIWKQLHAGTAGGDANGDGTPDPWTLLETTQDILALKHGETPARVFAVPPVRAALQVNREGSQDAGAFEVPQSQGLPKMRDMMEAALNVLAKDEQGFFLMAEGGAIDWAAHANKAGRLIEEQVDFDEAIAATAEWIEKHSSWDDTLLIITADHETGMITAPAVKPPTEWPPLENNGPGKMPGLAWHTGSHSNQLVPLFAHGAGAEQFLQHIAGEDRRLGPYVDNTTVATVVREVWR
jgi:alkaline phosphatase